MIWAGHAHLPMLLSETQEFSVLAKKMDVERFYVTF